MAATRVIMGVGESTSWPACNRTIREWFPASERAFANAVFGAGSAAGPAIGAMAVTTVVGFFGWRAGFYAAGAIGFLWLVLWWVVFDTPDRASWLMDTERNKILAERDGEVVRQRLRKKLRH
jgi:MFS family permease